MDGTLAHHLIAVISDLMHNDHDKLGEWSIEDGMDWCCTSHGHRYRRNERASCSQACDIGDARIWHMHVADVGINGVSDAGTACTQCAYGTNVKSLADVDKKVLARKNSIHCGKVVL